MPRSPRRARSLRRGASVALAVVGLVAACTTARRRVATTTVDSGGDIERPTSRGPRDASERTVRILLASKQPSVRLTAESGWRMFAPDGSTLLALPQPNERWILEQEGRLVSARREDSRAVPLRQSPIVVRPLDARGTIGFNGRRWRGELLVSVADGELIVVNRLRMDDYLRGVVPLEIGTSSPADAAAVEAQAVTARSYAVTRIGNGRAYDMTATTQDQVYGGAGVETAIGNASIDATQGLVLLYGGRVVNAPYHANCGGSTAAPQDSWRASAEPYLQRVSDRIPGTDRYYCDQAPRFRWTRTFAAGELREAVARYVRTLPGGAGGIGAVTNVAVTAVTPAGRVGTLTVDTDRGRWVLRGSEIRAALRSPAGELLFSTYFSVEVVPGRNAVQSLILKGGGNGHGVGMCQSGAIGRARAGQDFRTILRTYYPGTTVGTIQ